MSALALGESWGGQSYALTNFLLFLLLVLLHPMSFGLFPFFFFIYASLVKKLYFLSPPLLSFFGALFTRSLCLSILSHKQSLAWSSALGLQHHFYFYRHSLFLE
jgi:hypothetical protein